MQAVTKSDLRKEISAILTDADLNKITANKVRITLEKKFKVELTSLRSEIDSMVMDFVNSKCSDDESDEASDAGKDNKDKSDNDKSDEDTKKKASKRPAPSKNSAKKSRDSSNERESDSEDDEPKPSKKAKTTKKAKQDSDSDGEVKKKSKKSGKGNGFTRPHTLSPELAKLVGAESLARHEVVKKVWQIIKERNLYDPKNKRYTICDSDLMTVIGVKRFLTFGMLKYLRNHFID